ncbi:glutathione S-transferase family protein [Hyalangium gracile]|uniref:glutathione S-transferase family protein n=1 Tax=Hyalangium gracile TaxID=394092 RepID=UPI001CCDF58D|nr:glutathione S-transferase [Hyalangium gracile]
MTTPTRPIRLYRHPLSGHSHRAQLLLSMLGLPFELIEVDFAKGEHKRPEFVAKNNPFGQIPVLEDGDVTLADSNAILVYLASRYDTEGRWLPRDPVAAARVQQWLSVAAGQLAFGPSAARRVTLLGAKLDYEAAKATATQLFTVLDGQLANRRFLVGDAPTIADLAIYAYTALAPEGGISIEPYGHLRAWLARVEALPGFVPVQRTPARPAA